MRITVKKPGINGEGIAFMEKKPVFVPGAIPGETAETRILEENERYARAKLIRIVTPSPSRREPACAYCRECGGCALLHVRYEKQLEWKSELLKEALWKYGHVRDTMVRPIHASKQETGYRSALKMPVQSVNRQCAAGMYQPGTNHFVAIDCCLMHDEKLEAVRRTVLAILHEEQIPAYENKHGLRNLVMRRIDQKISIALITGQDPLPDTLIQKLSLLPEVVSIVQSVNTTKRPEYLFGSKSTVLYGEEMITVSFCGSLIALTPESFFQLNLAQAEALYTTAVSKIDPCNVLAEAYCGVGVMSILARDKARKVYGIEEVPGAVRCAEKNVELNRVPNLSFLCADAAKGLQELLKKTDVDTLLCDPPRSGLDSAMIETILSSSIRKIVYVSCNPATLGKNIHDLKQEFDVRTVIPFDLFPNTPHVESVTVLTRRGTSDRIIKRKKRKKENA